MMRCWASVVDAGNCGGGMSREHVISKNLWSSETITISAPYLPKPTTMSLMSATSRVLCRNHNTQLSPIDMEAGRLKDAILKLVPREGSIRDVSAKGGGGQHPLTLDVDGDLFARFLTKVHCGALQTLKRAFDPVYALHALGKATDHVHIYFPISTGDIMHSEERVAHEDLLDRTGADAGCRLAFFGLRWFVTATQEVEASEMVQVGNEEPRQADQFMERPREITHVVDVGEGVQAPIKLRFNWSDDTSIGTSQC